MFKYELNRIYRLTRNWMNMSVPYERESRWNVIECFATSRHVQLYQDSKREPSIHDANPKSEP